jgi:pilus assembly protein Flp/PilA
VGRLEGAVRRFLADRSGVTFVEYGIIVAGISVAVIVAVFLIGDDLVKVFEAAEAKVVIAINKLAGN